jgi:hypothetical protein
MAAGVAGTMAGIIATGSMAAGATVLRITASAGMAVEASMAAEAGMAAEATAKRARASCRGALLEVSMLFQLGAMSPPEA